MDPISHVLSDLVKQALEEVAPTLITKALEECLPAVLRRASLPVYLDKKQLMELTGWSARKVEYVKAERRLPFIRRGRTVLFPTDAVEEFFEAGRVDAYCARTQNGGAR